MKWFVTGVFSLSLLLTGGAWNGGSAQNLVTLATPPLQTVGTMRVAQDGYLYAPFGGAGNYIKVVNGAGDTMSGTLGIVAPAITDNSSLAVSSGWVQQLFGGKVTPNVEGTTNIPGIDGGSFMFWNAPTSSTSQFAQNATVRIDRHARYSGAAGTIEQGLQVNCEVGAAVSNYEWCGLVLLENYGIGANNVGVYMSAHRHTGALSTWGAVVEADDYDAASTAGVVSLEVDQFGTGAPATNNRIGIDVVAGWGGVIPSPTNPTFYAGMRIGASNGVTGQAAYIHGLTFNSGNYTSVISLDPLTNYAANFTHGVDLSRGTCAPGGDYVKGGYFIATCAGGLGVGNVSPQVALDVYSSGQANAPSPQIRVVGGTIDMRLNAADGSLGTYSNTDAVLRANGTEQARALAAGGFRLTGALSAPGLATSGGTAKGTLCSDAAGNIYVKTASGACL